MTKNQPVKTKETHNLKGCKCPKGSDISFCLGNQPVKTKEKAINEYNKKHGNKSVKNKQKGKLWKIKFISFSCFGIVPIGTEKKEKKKYFCCDCETEIEKQMAQCDSCRISQSV